MSVIYTAETLSSMGKEQLRQACRDIGISYGKLDNAGMRAKLLTISEFDEVEAGPPPSSTLVDLFGLNGKKAETKVDPKSITRVVDGKRIDETAPVVAPKPDIATLPRATSKDLKLEKVRETRNGVTRHSDGTIGAAIWAYYDKNPAVVSSDIPAIAAKHGWKEMSCRCSLYHWRKFMGMTGK